MPATKTVKQIDFLAARNATTRDELIKMTPAQIGREFARLAGREAKIYHPISYPSVVLNKEERRALLNSLTNKEN